MRVDVGPGHGIGVGRAIADPAALGWQDWLLDQWFQSSPSLPCRLLQPLSWIYGGLWRCRKHACVAPPPLRAPVVVVGNLVVGGAGKTPTVLALVESLRLAGWTPGVVSRGHGRRVQPITEVCESSDPRQVGDEPLLIHRRTRAPCVVGRQRLAAAHALLSDHPEVDLVVSDDGLQHLALPRTLEVVVFDERGIGNGLLLPAGPLREPFTPFCAASRLVLYNAASPSTPWGGHLAERSLAAQCDAVGAGMTERRELTTFRGRRVLAAAGIAVPERFFSALEAAGLTIDRLPLPDHHDYCGPLPWPAATAEVLVTEKDAVKLSGLSLGPTRVWAVPLDLQLPPTFMQAVLRNLPVRPPPGPQAAPPSLPDPHALEPRP